MSFVVTEPAADTQLLTIAEMRAAAGVSNTAQDAALTALGLRVAECIMDECGVLQEDSGEHPPTLLRERITETVEVSAASAIILSRRHAVELLSITSGADIVVEGAAGIVRQRSGTWSGTIVVDYYAGFATVPPALKQAAIDCFRLFWLERDRDPSLKGKETDIPGVRRERMDFWVGAVPGQASEGPVPAVVAGQLKRFRNMVVA